MNREFDHWPIAERWIEQMMFDGVIHLNDIPREIRINCHTFYVVAFRISRNISDTWFVQNLKLLEYDIMSIHKDSSERKKLLDMLSFNLDLGEGKKEVVDYMENMDKEILRELYDRGTVKQTMFQAQLEQFNKCGKCSTSSKNEGEE